MTETQEEIIVRRLIGDATATPLQQHVAEWIAERAVEYEGDTLQEKAGSALEDLSRGCSSGIVSHLIYHSDIAEWFEAYGSECEQIVSDLAAELGSTPGELLDRAGWDGEDPFAREDTNRGLLAWCGFEEAARSLGYNWNIEL